MKKWTSLGFALPTRSDVKPVAGRGAFVAVSTVHARLGQSGRLPPRVDRGRQQRADCGDPGQAERQRHAAEDRCGNEVGWRTTRSLLRAPRSDARRSGDHRETQRWQLRSVGRGERERSVRSACVRRSSATDSSRCRSRSSCSSSSSRSATPFYISRYDWSIFKGPFVGWDNYRELYHDQVFWRHAVRNTLVFTAFVVPLEMALGLSLAVVVNQAIRFRTFFRAAFYFPSLASSAAIVAIATYILASDGILNRFLGHLGYDHNKAWFTQQSTALPSIIGLNAWTTSGTIMLFYLAALTGDPDRRLRGGGDRRRRRVADVSEDHVSAAEAGTLLRRGRLVHRRAEDVRPVLHRRRDVRRAELLDDDGRPLPLQPGLHGHHPVRVRGGGRARPLLLHLHRDADPATALRKGRRSPECRSRCALRLPPSPPESWRSRARLRPEPPRQRGSRVASGATASGEDCAYVVDVRRRDPVRDPLPLEPVDVVPSARGDGSGFLVASASLDDDRVPRRLPQVPLRPLHAQQRDHRRRGHALERVPRVARRLRVRAASLPRVARRSSCSCSGR